MIPYSEPSIGILLANDPVAIRMFFACSEEVRETLQAILMRWQLSRNLDIDISQGRRLLLRFTTVSYVVRKQAGQ